MSLLSAWSILRDSTFKGLFTLRVAGEGKCTHRECRASRNIKQRFTSRYAYLSLVRMFFKLLLNANPYATCIFLTQFALSCYGNTFMVKGRGVREAGTAQGVTRHHQQGTGLTGRAGPRLFTQVRTYTVFTRMETPDVYPGEDPDCVYPCEDPDCLPTWGPRLCLTVWGLFTQLRTQTCLLAWGLRMWCRVLWLFTKCGILNGAANYHFQGLQFPFLKSPGSLSLISVKEDLLRGAPE